MFPSTRSENRQIGTTIIHVQDDDFFNGFQAGTLLYRLQASPAGFTDQQIYMFVCQHCLSVHTTDRYRAGAIAGWFAALSDCQRGYHSWHDTFTPGMSLCQICGTKGYCSTCFPGPPPDNACVRLCSKHRDKAGQPVHLGFSLLPEAANCTVGCHRWVKTAATGMSQCAMCGTRDYCFTCCPHAPADAVSAPCASHRAQAKEAQA